MEGLLHPCTHNMYRKAKKVHSSGETIPVPAQARLCTHANGIPLECLTLKTRGGTHM